MFDEHPEVSICSGIVEEFTTDPNTVDAKRVPPETNAEIVEFAKKRNPFNHPCVMYKNPQLKQSARIRISICWRTIIFGCGC